MAEFIKVAKVSEIPEGTGKTFQVDGRAVAVFHIGGQVYALDNTCLHRGGPLGEGTVEDGKVTCPWHHWQYDVRSGQRVGFEQKVAAHQAKLEGEDVLVA